MKADAVSRGGSEAVLGAYMEALRAGDRRRALAVVDSARVNGCDLRTLYLEVFQPALREIGRLWQEDELTVAEEHLATAITQMAMATMYDEVCAAAPVTDRLLVAACTDSERHEVGLRMVCDFAELDCWDVICLGSSVPLESLVKIIRARQPDAVALSASIAPHLPQIQSAIAAIRRLGDSAPFVLTGGRAFLDDPELARRLGADASARDAAEAMEQLRLRFG